MYLAVLSAMRVWAAVLMNLAVLMEVAVYLVPRSNMKCHTQTR